jgi:hypothetical protein
MAQKTIKGAGIGGYTYTIPSDLIKNSDYTDIAGGWDFRIKQSGDFSNCSYWNNYSLYLTNPASDSTFYCYLEFTVNEATWYDLGYFYGILYHSMGVTNISISGLKTMMGSSYNNLHSLSQLPPVNKYAPFKPNGSTPDSFSEFRYYAHNVLGGVVLYAPSLNNIQWYDYYNGIGIGSKMWIEKTNLPFAHTRLKLYKNGTLVSTGADTDISGSNSIVVRSSNYQNLSSTATNETWITAVEHYYNSTWTEDSRITYSISLLGKPWSISLRTPSRNADIASITWSYYSGSYNCRFGIYTRSVWRFSSNVLTDTYAEVSDSQTIPAGTSWKFEVYFNSQWIQEGSGTLA